MKLRKFLIFCMILVGILGSLSGWCNQVYLKQNETVTGRNQSLVGIQKEQKNSIDVLVLGDSESYTTFSPMVMWENSGITSYVCGQSGQQIPETYFMLKQALKRQSPKLLLLETNLLFRNEGRVNACMTAASEIGMYHFSIFRYHDGWKQALGNKKSVDQQYFKGFSIRDSIASYDGKEYMKETKNKKEIPMVIKYYVSKILELCKENNIQVMFYSAPSPRNYNMKKHNALSEYTKQEGIDYMDFNFKTKELGIDWKRDSLDHGDHLNIAGAHKVSKYLAAYLPKKYQIKDHRGEQQYQKWDAMLTTYQKLETEKIARIQQR